MGVQEMKGGLLLGWGIDLEMCSCGSGYICFGVDGVDPVVVVDVEFWEGDRTRSHRGGVSEGVEDSECSVRYSHCVEE